MAGEEGASVLETKSYIISIVFLIFCVLFVLFEKLIEWRREHLTKRHKLGLLACLNAVTSEVMLFGLASLLLNLFEDPITKICIPASGSTSWTILSVLDGCPCCLRNTRDITECWLDGRECGTDLCNCNGADPGCLAGATEGFGAPERRLLASAPWYSGRGLLQETTSATQCVGINEYSQAECGYRPGYKQALSSNAIQQIHTMLFYIAVGHVLCSYIMVRISTSRIKIWKHWLKDEDAHTKAVHAKLDEYTNQKWHHKHKHSKEHSGEADSTPNSPKGIMRLFSKSKKFATDSAHGPDDQANVDLAAALNRKFSRHDAARTAATASEEPALAAEQQGDESGIMLTGSEAYSDAPEGPPGVTPQDPPGVTPLGSAQQAPGHKGRRLTKLKPKEGMLHHDVALMWWQHAQKRHQFVKRAVGRSSAPQGEDEEGDAAPAEDQDVEAGPESKAYLADEAAAEQVDAAAVQQAAGTSGRDEVALDVRLPDEVHVEHPKAWSGRQGTFDKRREYGKEWVKCFFRQFAPQTIHPAEISIMRASFILTHRPGKKFSFMDYILASMDDDCAKVVGLGPSVWLTVAVFVLLAGVIGWASTWFALLAVLLELIMNTKLIYIARHTARGGAVHRLQPSIFWFGQKGPWVMLTVIKTLLFLCSFIYTSLVFFAINFGVHSCFFHTPGLNTPSLPMPWWVVLIINTAVYLALSFITVPLYSLGVQMGSGFRPHILSPNVKNRLLDISKANKEKVRQRNRQAGNTGMFKKISGKNLQRLRRKRQLPRSQTA